MALRFLDDASIRRRLKSGGVLLLTAFIALGLLACGGSPEAPSADESAAAEAPAKQDYQQQLHDLEVQIETLKQQSEAMRREVVSRLDQIDVTREALEVQLEGLRGEAPPAGDTAPAAPETASPESEATAPAPVDPTEPAAEPGTNPFLRFVLLIFILGAIFFLARIFFDRWGDTEDGERPPTVEATTDLGKIRFPPGTEAHPEEGDEPPTGDPEDVDEGRPGD